MAEPFISEIMMFGGSFSPRGWAYCQGQLLDSNSFSALYSLIGTRYGGGSSGRITVMGLPDLRGCTPIGEGQLPGGSNYQLGQSGGLEAVVLTQAQLPPHTHDVTVTTGADENGKPNAKDPNGNYLSDGQVNDFFSKAGGSTPQFKLSETGPIGSNSSHNNMQPYLTVNYCIALTGTFPARN